jgi:hypothetical protein
MKNYTIGWSAKEQNKCPQIYTEINGWKNKLISETEGTILPYRIINAEKIREMGITVRIP